MDKFLPIAWREPLRPVNFNKIREIYNKYASSPGAESANSYSFGSEFRWVIWFRPGLRQTLRMPS